AVDLMSSRRPFCQAMGAEKVVILGEQSLADEVRAWTDGYGVDAAVICTATQSNTPIEQAAEAVRDRARFVIVGNTRAELAWRIFYEKELEVRYSRSYGPGRYDPSYEWGGADYPIGYVRWTEQRNFQACLDLIGEGNFARTMLLPHLKGRLQFGVVANQTALSANHVKTRFSFERAATDAAEILGAPNSASAQAASETGAPSAVLIATRHHLHGPLVKQALAANRHVFVEKPLCLSRQELAEIDEIYAKGKGTLMVGFNRRFAPASSE